MAEMELEAVLVLPVDRDTSLAVDAEGSASQVLAPDGRTGSRACCSSRRRVDRQDGEASLASGIQRAGSHQRLAPYSETARSKLASGKRHILGVRFDEWKVEPCLILHPARRVELCRSDVDADGSCALSREPRGEVGGPAPELDHVETCNVAERVQLRFGNAEDAPGEGSVRPTPFLRYRPCTRRSSASRARGSARRSRAQTRPSGKKSASSRRALAFESEPCTMFSESSSAKSPRIVPGAESSGFVAPIIVRTTEIADSPLTASASTGPDVMKSTREPKNGLPLCSA